MDLNNTATPTSTPPVDPMDKISPMPGMDKPLSGGTEVPAGTPPMPPVPPISNDSTMPVKKRSKGPLMALLSLLIVLILLIFYVF